MNNYAAYMTDIGKLEIKECPIPEPKAGELLIRVEYVGVCGSDVHFFNQGRIGKKVLEFPFILGHEFSGEVVGLGDGVRNFQTGDRVVIEPGLGCGECAYCKSGRYNLCRDMKFMASPPNNGALRRYLTYPARGCFKLADNVSNLEGAMIEPLAVGLYAAEKGQVNCRKTVVILGMGCIGLMTLLACKAFGAKKIIVADVLPNRLEKARELGADAALDGKEEDLEARLAELTDGALADLVFETAGRPETTVQAAALAGRGATIVQVGNVTEITPYRFIDIMMKEVRIETIYRYCNMFPFAIDLISAGKLDVKAIGPELFDFYEVQKAFEYSVTHASDVTKCMIRLSEG